MRSIGICDFYPRDLEKFLKEYGSVKIFSKGPASRHAQAVISCMKHYAPEVSLSIALGSLKKSAELEEMLKWLETEKVDVVNLSLGYRKRQPGIEEVIARLISSGTVIFAAQSDSLPYPWSLENVISVGRHGMIKRWKTRSEGLSGASMACAEVSGMFASYQGSLDDFVQTFLKKRQV